MSTSQTVPKAVLYYSKISQWSAAALLALVEKGYGHDEVDLRAVDLAKGENFAPSFLRLNVHATVPTLVVPLEQTLSADTESRYKSLTNTKAIVEFLDKSRSAISHTHTTSAAPAPALAPATIAFTAISDKVIGEVHSDDASPATLLYMNARDPRSLKAHATTILPYFQGRQKALEDLLSQNEAGTIRVSAKVKAYWEDKKIALRTLIDVLSDAEKTDAELDAEAKKKREDYFATAKNAWESLLKKTLISVNQQIIGPYVLGDQFSLADIHLTAWLARIAKLSGSNQGDDGSTAVGRIEAHVGGDFSLPKEPQPAEDSTTTVVYNSRLAVFWDAVKDRPSWQKIYADGLR